MSEFEPFIRCADSEGIDDFGSAYLCPKNTMRAVPSSLEGQLNIVPLPPSIIMMSCEEASNSTMLGMPDPDSCFKGEKTREMSDDDYRVLTNLRQRSNETFAFLSMRQRQVVLGDDDTSISLTT